MNKQYHFIENCFEMIDLALSTYLKCKILWIKIISMRWFEICDYHEDVTCMFFSTMLLLRYYQILSKFDEEIKSIIYHAMWQHVKIFLINYTKLHLFIISLISKKQLRKKKWNLFVNIQYYSILSHYIWCS